MELNLNEAQSRGGSNSRLAIECSRAVLEQILADVEQGFYSVPHGGAEMGGVLYGSYDGSRILIQAARPMLCEHAHGPSFTLSVADYSRLAALLQVPGREPDFAGMAVVGWYHSHTRSEISFADADIEIHDRFFPKPWQVALVLRPSAMRPTEVGIFVREADGTMRRSAPAVEASLTPAGAVRNERAQPATGAAAAPRTGPYRNRPAAAAATPKPVAAVTPEPVAAVAPEPVAAVAPEPVAAVAPEPVRKGRWRWPVAAALLLVAAASGGYLAYWWPQRPAPAVAGLQLHATDRNGQLEIGWDGNLPALRLARSGTLEISEGPRVHIFPMDAEFLRRGSISYTRHSEVVTVRISVMLQDGSELQQQWAFVGDLGSGRAVPAQVAAQQPPAPEAVPEPARNQVVEIQALRKLRQGSEASGQALGSERAPQSPARPATQERTFLGAGAGSGAQRGGANPGASAPTSRAAAVRPVIAKPLPPAVTPPRSLPDRASTRAPVHATTTRLAPEPRSETAAARNQPSSSSATAAAVRGKPLPPPAAASAAPSTASPSRPVAQVVQPPPPTLSTPATSRPEPVVGNVAVPASPEPVARTPEGRSAPLLNTVAPPARVNPVTQPAVAAPSLSGRWTFGPTSPSGSPFPPESVALSLSEIGGLLQGTLAGRYRTPRSSGLQPDVRFSFQGPARAGNMRFPWATSDGTKGSVELIRLPNRSDSIEVVWYSQDRKFIFDDVLVRVTK